MRWWRRWRVDNRVSEGGRGECQKPALRHGGPSALKTKGAAPGEESTDPPMQKPQGWGTRNGKGQSQKPHAQNRRVGHPAD
jgi:hypothetical protein